MRLAHEFKRPDWRRMLSEMSASELGAWGEFFTVNSFSDLLLDAQFATLKSLLFSLVSAKDVPSPDEFSLITLPVAVERTEDELMTAGEGIIGGVRYEPSTE